MVLSMLAWIEITAYFAALFAVGFYFACLKWTSKDYFLACDSVCWAGIRYSFCGRPQGWIGRSSRRPLEPVRHRMNALSSAPTTVSVLTAVSAVW
jgi:hypothetical protein